PRGPTAGALGSVPVKIPAAASSRVRWRRLRAGATRGEASEFGIAFALPRVITFEPGMGPERGGGPGDADHEIARVAVGGQPALPHERRFQAGGVRSAQHPAYAPLCV